MKNLTDFINENIVNESSREEYKKIVYKFYHELEAVDKEDIGFSYDIDDDGWTIIFISKDRVKNDEEAKEYYDKCNELLKKTDTFKNRQKYNIATASKINDNDQAVYFVGLDKYLLKNKKNWKIYGER